MAAHRRTGRRQTTIRTLQPATGDGLPERGAVLEGQRGGRGGLSADDRKLGAEPLRRALVARLPSPCLPGDARLRLPGLGATPGRAGPEPAGERAATYPGMTALELLVGGWEGARAGAGRQGLLRFPLAAL